MRQIIYSVIITLFALPAWAQFQIASTTSSGGITAWYIDEPSIPMVSLQIGFRGAGSLDPDAQLGATYVMAGLLEEGAGGLSDIEYKTALEEIAAGFSFESSRESVTISATFLKETMPQAIDLLRKAIAEPNFDPAAIARVKDQVNSIIASRATDPNDLVADHFYSTVFAGHPYARPYQGTAETIAALTRDDLIAAHQRALVKDRLYVGVVGDITADEINQMLDTLFGDLPASNGMQIADIAFQASSGIDVIDLDTPQSVAFWGHAGIKRDDPAFFAAFLMNHILGGSGFTSRLTKELREKRGLTYGVSSFLAGLDHAQFIGGALASSNETMAQAIDLIRAEWDRMANHGVTDAELQAAKDYLTGSYALRFDGNAKLASILLYSQMDGFAIDYPSVRNDLVNGVTKDDIAALARRLLRTGDLYFAVVGRPEGL